MSENEKSEKSKMPKGGRKGGTIFPRIGLKQAIDYSDKLVAKTHTGPQPKGSILPGVFGNAGPTGEIRASALKQFGLMEGSASAYQATKLAKEIDAAPPEDKVALLQQSFMNPKIFKQIFETFHGDAVNKFKIRQRALGLKVHPDSADECVDRFVESATEAGLATVEGDAINLSSVPGSTNEQQLSGDEDRTQGGEDENAQESKTSHDAEQSKGAHPLSGRRPQSAGITVNLNVDSTSDPDKLQKQLELLKRFGVI